MKHGTHALALAISLGISQAWALAISVDGNLNDWGISPSTWLPSDPRIHHKIEDQTGNANAYLGPGWGGQAYDAEAMYALIQGNRLYVAMATGHDPRTLHKPSANSYGAGDFFLDFGKNGTYEVAININHKLPTGFESTFTEGGVYKGNLVCRWAVPGDGSWVPRLPGLATGLSDRRRLSRACRVGLHHHPDHGMGTVDSGQALLLRIQRRPRPAPDRGLGRQSLQHPLDHELRQRHDLGRPAHPERRPGTEHPGPAAVGPDRAGRPTPPAAAITSLRCERPPRQAWRGRWCRQSARGGRCHAGRNRGRG